MIITVDCGTTNMRCRLFDGMTCLDETKRKAGIRNTAFDGTNAFLRQSLHDSVAELLERNRCTESDIEIILSSGTLSSDVGIYRVPHIQLPAGVQESALNAVRAVLPELTSIPILFIPGVKTLPEAGETNELRRIDRMESMSGEDCETYGLMELLGLRGNFFITLPGSYNKLMEVNGEGKMISIRTGMCGEFLAAVAEHTLLKHSLPSPVIREILPEKLCLGFDYCALHGTSPSLIKGRMLQIHSDYTADEAANFYVGAVLHDDITEVAKAVRKGMPLVLGGGNPLRRIFALLLTHAGCPDFRETTDEEARLAPSIGAIAVYRAYKALHRG